MFFVNPRRSKSSADSVTCTFCIHIPCLASPNRSENSTNRKIYFFCIETVNKIFFQLQKKNFFSRWKKIWIFSGEKSEKINYIYIFFNENFFKHNGGQKSKFFFRPQKIFFSELKKKCLQFRCRKSRSFDCRCFRNDSGTLSGSTKNPSKFFWRGVSPLRATPLRCTVGKH